MVQIVPPPGWVPAVEPHHAEAIAAPPVEANPAAASRLPVGAPLLVWGLGGSALLLVICLVGLVGWSGEDSAETPLPTAAAAAPHASPPATEPVFAEESAHEEAQEDFVDELPAESPSAEVPAAEVAAEETTATPAIATELPELPAENAIAAEEQAISPPAVSPAPAATAANDGPVESSPPDKTERRQPVLTFDPLDFDPTQLSLGSSTGSPSVVSTGSNEADETASHDKGTLAIAPPPSDPSAERAKQEPDGDPAVSVRVGPASTDALRPRNVAEQMALRIESFEVPALPLTRLVDAIAEMADVAITLDPSVLEMTGVSPRATVELRARGTTLDALLREALAQHRLNYIERDGRITLNQPAADRRRSVDYEVKELLEPGAADASEVAKLVQRMVAPHSWQAGEASIQVEGTKLRVDHVTGIHAQILVFCERLRLARGLPLRSRYPAAALSADSPYVKLGPILGKQTTFTFLPWTRLTDIFRHWEQSSGVTILVDWNALAKEELGPSSPVACAAIAKPWSEALDAVLEPLGLAWWAASGETIQITSRAAMDGIARIEFYPLSTDVLDQFASTDSLMESLQKEMFDEFPAIDGATAAHTHIEFDAPSSRLIVLGPPVTQRYLSRRLLVPSLPQDNEQVGSRTNATPNDTP